LKNNTVYIKNCWEDKANIEAGTATAEGGKFAALAMKQAVADAKEGLIDAIVTAPINKIAMGKSDFGFPGHTEFLQDAFNVKESLMMMVSDSLRVALVTNHTPLKDVVGQITKEKLTSKIKVLEDSLKKDFGIEKPTIAILGLNPHAGDEGNIGQEEQDIIRPVIVEAKKNGQFVSGPFPADGFFGTSQFQKFDAILAMYHDQGLVPFKALTFGSGVNFTAGLPIVRTSPDHGTAYDIVGKNMAELSSFRTAIFSAIDIARTRKWGKDAERRKEKPKLVEKGHE